MEGNAPREKNACREDWGFHLLLNKNNYLRVGGRPPTLGTFPANEKKKSFGSGEIPWSDK